MSRFSVILPEGSVLLKNEETSQVLRLSAEEGPLCLGTVEMSMLLNPMPVPVPSVKALAEDQASPEESTPSEEVEEVSTSSDEKEEAPSEEPPKEPETPKPAFLSRLEAQAEASRAQREAERRGERWASVAPVVSMAAVSSTPSTPIPEEKDEYSLRDEEESLSSSEEGEGVNTFFAPSEAPAPQFVMPKIETPVPVFEPGLHETLDRVEHGEPWMPPPVLPAGSSPSASMDAKNLTQKINTLKNLLESGEEASQANEEETPKTLSAEDYPEVDPRQLSEIPTPPKPGEGLDRNYIRVLDAPLEALTAEDFDKTLESMALRRNNIASEMEYLREIEGENEDIEDLGRELDELDALFAEVIDRKEAFDKAIKLEDEEN